MVLLLSNDDGIYAPDLDALYQVLKYVSDVEVVASDRTHRGASNELSINTLE